MYSVHVTMTLASDELWELANLTKNSNYLQVDQIFIKHCGRQNNGHSNMSTS